MYSFFQEKRKLHLFETQTQLFNFVTVTVPLHPVRNISLLDDDDGEMNESIKKVGKWSLFFL